VNEDVTGLLAEVAAGHLRTDPHPTTDAAVCVVLASAGYPTSPRSGDPIEGLDRAGMLLGVDVLHAGTALDDQGRIVTAGGRVLGVTATGQTVSDARARAYGAVEMISWDGVQYRTDIAADARDANSVAVGVGTRARGAGDPRP
jgi:phosphoribosylamine--glycine ligase